MFGFWDLVLEALRDVAFFLWFFVIASQALIGCLYLGYHIWKKWQLGVWSRRRAALFSTLLTLGLILYPVVFRATMVYFYDISLFAYEEPPGWGITVLYLFVMAMIGVLVDVLIAIFRPMVGG